MRISLAPQFLAFTMVGLALSFFQATPMQADGIADLVKTRCAECHGLTGLSKEPDDPKLAGQKPAYLRAQLRAFRDGSRPSEEMREVAIKLTDGQIAALADFFAAQKPAPDKPKSSALVQAGERIFTQRGRGIPPCAACHRESGSGGWRPGQGMGGMMMGGGMMGHGMGMNDPQLTPHLNGQHATYLVNALDEFSSRKRPSQVMQRVAATLAPQDRKAVATYLSGLR